MTGRYVKSGCRTGPPGWESIPGHLTGLQIRSLMTIFAHRDFMSLFITLGIGCLLETLKSRAHICKRLWSPGIDSARLGIDSWAPYILFTNTRSSSLGETS
jgi:hypothetical protein